MGCCSSRSRRSRRTARSRPGVLAEHLRRGLAAGPGGIFAACGTGEFHALAPEEYQEVVATAVKEADAPVPVFAGLRRAAADRDPAGPAGQGRRRRRPPADAAVPGGGAAGRPDRLHRGGRRRHRAAGDRLPARQRRVRPRLGGVGRGAADRGRVQGRPRRPGPARPDRRRGRPGAARTSRSSSSTGCPRRRRPSPPTGPSASSCTPRPRSASRPRCRWRSTGR